MGGPFGVVTRFVDACFESEYTFDEVHDLVEMPLEASRDVFMHEETLTTLYFPRVFFRCTQ